MAGHYARVLTVLTNQEQRLQSDEDGRRKRREGKGELERERERERESCKASHFAA
jgi:hypothetical protein